MSANLAIWNALKRTDPKATKSFKRAGGFSGTQIDPVWRMQRMTEVFGPVGQGWGWEQVAWTVVERMVFTCVRVWYRDPEGGETRWTGEQWGGTELVRRNRDGTERPDDEAFKMSMTDAVGKCLLQLGLAADVYLGEFDASKYAREDADAEKRGAAPPSSGPADKPAAPPSVRAAAIVAFEAEVAEKLAGIADLDGLDGYRRDEGFRGRYAEVKRQDEAAAERIKGLFSRRKAELLDRSNPLNAG